MHPWRLFLVFSLFLCFQKMSTFFQINQARKHAYLYKNVIFQRFNRQFVVDMCEHVSLHFYINMPAFLPEKCLCFLIFPHFSQEMEDGVLGENGPNVLPDVIQKWTNHDAERVTIHSLNMEVLIVKGNRTKYESAQKSPSVHLVRQYIFFVSCIACRH